MILCIFKSRTGLCQVIRRHMIPVLIKRSAFSYFKTFGAILAEWISRHWAYIGPFGAMF